MLFRSKIFGVLKNIEIEFGSIHYSFGGYRSQILLSGGGIFLESGSHWIDSALYISRAQQIDEFKVNVEYEDDLDIHSSGEFKIKDINNNVILCNFKFSCIENTKNCIKFFFSDNHLILNLFEDNSNTYLLRMLFLLKHYLKDLNRVLNWLLQQGNLN